MTPRSSRRRALFALTLHAYVERGALLLLLLGNLALMGVAAYRLFVAPG